MTKRWYDDGGEWRIGNDDDDDGWRKGNDDDDGK